MIKKISKDKIKVAENIELISFFVKLLFWIIAFPIAKLVKKAKKEMIRFINAIEE